MATDQDHVLINRSVFINTASNYIGKFINLVTWFFLTPFILSRLGGDIYGLWILVGSLVSYGSLFDLGIAAAITKYVAEYSAKGDYDQANQLIATALSLYSGLGLIVILISILLAPFFPTLFSIPAEQHNLSIALVILSGTTIGLSIPSTLAPAVLRGLQRFDYVNLISTAGTLSSAIIIVTVLLSGGGALGLVITSLSVNLLMQIPSILLIRHTAPALRIGWRGSIRQVIWQVSSFSLTLFILNLNGFLETKTDELVIGANLPLKSITPYNIVLRLSSLSQTLTSQFLFQILPLASVLHAKNEEAKLRALYISSTRITLALFLPVGIILCVLASPILSLWVGPQYASYSYLVVILTLASLIDTSQWPAGLILQGMARHKLLAVVSLLSGISNLILSIILVRSYGLVGVAVGTLIPTSMVCIFFVLPYSMRMLGIRAKEVVFDAFLPSLIPALPMIGVLYVFKGFPAIYAPLFLLLAAATGMLTYGLGYLSLKANSAERQAVGNLMNRFVRTAKAMRHLS